MIAVTGEALIDLVAGSDGHFAARPGGAPFNTARAISRLGLTPAFLGRLSADRFGRLLRSTLDSDGVLLAVPEPADVPTTLALIDVDADGLPRYSFYLDGTSAPALEYPVLAAALPAGLTALHAGGLALATEPIATSIDRLISTDLPPGALLMIDPNCRPEVIADRQAYLARLSRILRRADVVKVSVEDLDYLAPGTPAPDAAAALLGQGAALVLLTDGPHPARAFLGGEVVSAEVPAVTVADTVGAGDAFGGAFLAWWSRSGLTRSDLGQPAPVHGALRAAAEVAALTCTRVGAEPPWLAEVRDRPGWRDAATLR
ncbi:MAG TPA: PfkB family carbohydrate kinase [Streptosporangiaceae bacterium]